MASKTKYLRVDRVDADESWLGPPGLLCVPDDEIRSALSEYTTPQAVRSFAAKLLAAAEAAEAAEAAATSRWRR